MFLATTRSGLSGVIFRQWLDIECSALELKRYPVTRYFRRAKLLVFKTSKAPLTFLNAIVILGVWGPTLSAIIVTAMFYGKDGLKRFLARVNAREGLKWFLPLPGFFLLIGLAGHFIGSAATGIDLDPRFWGWAWVVQVMLVQLLIAGMGEEFGWRGFALHRLQHIMTPLKATLVSEAIVSITRSVPGATITFTVCHPFLFVYPTR